ncbi:MAG TPA: sulfatase-like hydrolase/transferase [bacterium]|nr:sulfatase-like hydrolase/transferase [bacterium]
MKTRREFLKTSAALAVAGAATRACTKPRPKSDRPNVLLILDDEERYHLHLPRLTLPNRQRLRQSAVVFSHACCTYPLCSPSRSTIFTGLWPHQAGIITNVDKYAENPSLDPAIPNLGSVFSRAGYETAYFGKWHLSRNGDAYGTPRAYGFKYPFVSNQEVGWRTDHNVSVRAAAWLKKNAGQTPWLMAYCPVNPHDILVPELAGQYGGLEKYAAALPPNFAAEPAPGIKTLEQYGETRMIKDLAPKDRAGWLDYIRYYCRLIEDVDQQLGRVLDALEASGQWDNTIVVFTSDHGEMAGSHGLAYKGHTMYEENIRVPLWISDPRHVNAPRAHDGLVSHLDLVPTLSALAGVPWPAPLTGLDLSPIIESGKDVARDRVFCEGSVRVVYGFRGIRTEPWKYWHYNTGEELLFNLKDDPLELKNLASDPGSAVTLAGLREQVRQWRRDTNDPMKEFM